MEVNVVKAKIKYLLSTSRHTVKQYADHLGRLPQSVNRKLTENRYGLKDLVDLADYTNTDLAFLDKNTGKPVIIITKEDLVSEVKTTKEDDNLL